MLKCRWAAFLRTVAYVAFASAAWGAELRESPIRGVGFIGRRR